MKATIEKNKKKLAEMRARIEHNEPYLQDDPGGGGRRAQDQLRREAAELENSILRMEMAEMKRQQMPKGWFYDHETGILYNDREPFARVFTVEGFNKSLSIIAAATITDSLNRIACGVES